MKKYVYSLVVVLMVWVQMLVPAAAATDSPRKFQGKIMDLLGSRSVGLVIYNDIWENYRDAHRGEFPFPWSDHFYKTRGVSTIVFDLLKAFTSRQTLLCTKTLWYQLQFFARMWEDFANMEFDSLMQEYGHYGDFEQEVELKIEQYRNVVRELDQFYRLNSQMGSSAREELAYQGIVNIGKRHLIDDLGTIYVWQALYRVYLEVINKQIYRCYDVNEWYLLFVPASLVHNITESVPRETIMSDPHLTWLGMVAGLCLNLPESDQYCEYLSQVDEYQIMVSHPSLEYLGDYAVDAVSKIMFDKRKIKKEFAQYGVMLLPTFNVLMVGHGHQGKSMAGITTDSVVKVLRVLDQQAFIASVSIGSCFMGGKGLKDFALQLDNELRQIQQTHIIQDLSFPVIFGSSFFSPISLRSTSLAEPFLFYKWLEEKLYQRFFDALTQQDQTTQLPPPYYLKAMDMVFDIVDDQGLVKLSRLHQYVSIKFPKVPFIQAYDYDKRVKKITPISASYQDVIKIPKDIRVVLMCTDFIVAPVEIVDVVKIHEQPSVDRLSWLTFLPVHYRNQNYKFREIRIPHVEGLHQGNVLKNVMKLLQDLFFTVPYHALGGESKAIKELIYIVIENMMLGDVRLGNIALSLNDLQGAFEIQLPGQAQSAFYTFKYENGQWDIKVDPSEDAATPYLMWVSSGTRGSKALEKKAFSVALNKVLKQSEEQVADIVKASRSKYSNMSHEAKQANISRRYKPGLNPNAKPFVPSGVTQPKVLNN